MWRNLCSCILLHYKVSLNRLHSRVFVCIKDVSYFSLQVKQVLLFCCDMVYTIWHSWNKDFQNVTNFSSVLFYFHGFENDVASQDCMYECVNVKGSHSMFMFLISLPVLNVNSSKFGLAGCLTHSGSEHSGWLGTDDGWKGALGTVVGLWEVGVHISEN